MDGGYIDAVLGSVQKAGYIFKYEGGGTRSPNAWCVQAVPVKGGRHFFLDESGVIRASTGPADASSLPID